MARYLQLLARAFGVGTIVVITAIVARQTYLHCATEAGMAGVDEGRARMMLVRCETMHARLQNRHSSEDTADADEPARIRCRES